MENKKQRKFHYAWLILVSCFALYGGTMGVGYNCSGVFNAAVSAAMGWKISEFTLAMFFMGAASALTLLAADRIFRKCSLKLVLACSVSIYALTLALKCVCSELWHFYLLYAVNGAAAAFLFYVPVPMLLNSWFRKSRGLALGIAMLSSGILGAVMNPVLSAVIETEGWRTAAVVNGIVSLVIALPPVLLFVRRSPKEMGLRPYGAEEIPEQPLSVKTSPSQVDEMEYHNPYYSGREKKTLFRYSFVLAVIVLVISMIPQQLAHFARVNGMSAAVGAAFVTMGMTGNMISKAVMGGCVDRFGKKKTFSVSFLLVAAGFLVFALLPGAPPALLYPAAFLTGVSAANNVVVMPFMVGVYSSGEEYTYYMSKVSVASMIGTACGTFVCSAIYDLAGSYTPELLFFLAMDLAALAIVRRIIAAEKQPAGGPGADGKGKTEGENHG